MYTLYTETSPTESLQQKQDSTDSQSVYCVDEEEIKQGICNTHSIDTIFLAPRREKCFERYAHSLTIHQNIGLQTLQLQVFLSYCVHASLSSSGSQSLLRSATEIRLCSLIDFPLLSSAQRPQTKIWLGNVSYDESLDSEDYLSITENLILCSLSSRQHYEGFRSDRFGLNICGGIMVSPTESLCIISLREVST